MGQWIWKFGEFETYHNLLVHNRRQTYGESDPPVWKLYAPEPVVRFKKRFISTGGTIRVSVCGIYSLHILRAGDRRTIASYHQPHTVELPEGDIEIHVRVSNASTFPCLHIDGAVETDGSWLADDSAGDLGYVGTWDKLTDPKVTPEVFPFDYEPIFPVSKEYINGGVLFDFGKETFARTEISGIGGKALLCFGESKEEALDKQWSVIRFNVESGTKLPAYAFRYIFVDDENAEIKAEYEYLAETVKGGFDGDPLLKRIWDVAAYTFHLNSREFILDGIKRDRWVWSADAYQSFFINHYLFADKELEKRTLTALGGKAPIRQYINTIMDYTFFWIMGIYEYYLFSGDAKFLEQIYPVISEHVAFFSGRRDEDGFIRGRDEDWIFIDWADMDKTGALIGEQILMAKALECYGKIGEIIGRPDPKWQTDADLLVKNIFGKYLDDELGVFIDSFESGKRNVTRHSNILAYLYLPCGEELKSKIYNDVVCNDDIPAITTPYFKFYENQVHADRGNIGLLEDLICEYYGGMLDIGATTLFEQFDPTQSGVKHYEMYDRPFEKSLCHAWSTSPIYLIGRYRAGVRNTGTGYDTFEVKPYISDGKVFSSTVPLPDGSVKVSFDGKYVVVLTDCDGGRLIVNDKEQILTAGTVTKIGV